MKITADVYLDSDDYMYIHIPDLHYSFLIRAEKGCYGSTLELETEQHSIGSVMRRMKELMTVVAE